MQTPPSKRVGHVLVPPDWSIPDSQPPKDSAGSAMRPSASVVDLGLPRARHLKSGFLPKLEIASTKVGESSAASSATRRTRLFFTPANAPSPTHMAPFLHGTPAIPSM